MSWWTNGGEEACKNVKPLQLSISILRLIGQDKSFPFSLIEKIKLTCRLHTNLVQLIE